MSIPGVPDGPWKKARCPHCARWIGVQPKQGRIRQHKIGLGNRDPLCPGSGKHPAESQSADGASKLGAALDRHAQAAKAVTRARRAVRARLEQIAAFEDGGYDLDELAREITSLVLEQATAED